MTDTIHVALIDDDEAVRDSLQLYLKRKHVRATCFQAAEDFLKTLNGGEAFDCIVADVRMPRMSGLDLVQHLMNRGSTRPIILITGHGDIDMAVSAVKAGAFDFIEKPFDESRLLASIRGAVEKGRAEDEGQRGYGANEGAFSSCCPCDSDRSWNWPRRGYRTRKSATSLRSAQRP